MSDLLKLAERIEASAGPDRKLDAAICDWLRDNSGFVPNRADIAYPFYAFTESLDAAMQLVPEGYWHGYQTSPGGFRAHCFEQTIGSAFYASTSATPALALCAAALRARAAR